MLLLTTKNIKDLNYRAAICYSRPIGELVVVVVVVVVMVVVVVVVVVVVEILILHPFPQLRGRQLVMN